MLVRVDHPHRSELLLGDKVVLDCRLSRETGSNDGDEHRRSGSKIVGCKDRVLQVIFRRVLGRDD